MQIHAELIIAPSLADAHLPDEYAVPSVDVDHVVQRQFGIDDARALALRAAGKAVAADERIFVIACKTMTTEAQNALLKLFEDPPARAHFILIVPSESIIIPTLRSRFVAVRRADHEENEAAKLFLHASYTERLATIAALNTRKDTEGMEALARDVAHELLALGTRDAWEVAAFVESQIRIKGGSRKMLLEHLALSVPPKNI